MKLKTLAILTLGIFGCAVASAQTFGFGTAIGGSGLYCNYYQVTYLGGGLWAGIDNLSVCGDSYSTIVGFAATVPGVGPSAHGRGVVWGDSIYAVYNGCPECQWTVFTKFVGLNPDCNKKNKSGKFIGTNHWEGVAAFSGVFAGSVEGPLSCTIPGKNGVTPTKGVNTPQKN
jgi:hypothetical protein